MISALLEDDGKMSKEELIKAQGGDYRFFASLDADKSGSVSPLEWILWLRTQHAQRSAQKVSKGDQWFELLMHGLKRGCGVLLLTPFQLNEVPFQRHSNAILTPF